MQVKSKPTRVRTSEYIEQKRIRERDRYRNMTPEQKQEKMARDRIRLQVPERKAELQASRRDRYSNNVDVLRDGARKCYASLTLEQKAARHALQRLNDAKPEYKLKRKTTHIESRYGLSKEQWDDLFISQGSKCLICSSTESGDKRGHWHTDHCHATGRLRGILCRGCNHLLGHAKDNVDTLQAAIDYLNH